MTTCVFNPALETSAKLVLSKFPGVEFSTQNFVFPEIRAVFPEQSYPHQWVHMGPSGYEFGDFTLEFMVDSQLENYRSIVQWILDMPTMEHKECFSDAQVIFTDALKRPNGVKARLLDLMPTHITRLEYKVNVASPQPLIAVATFKYTKFQFE